MDPAAELILEVRTPREEVQTSIPPRPQARRVQDRRILPAEAGRPTPGLPPQGLPQARLRPRLLRVEVPELQLPVPHRVRRTILADRDPSSPSFFKARAGFICSGFERFWWFALPRMSAKAASDTRQGLQEKRGVSGHDF